MSDLIWYEDTLMGGEQQVGVFFSVSQKEELFYDIVNAGADQVVMRPTIHPLEEKLFKRLIENGYKDNICVSAPMEVAMEKGYLWWLAKEYKVKRLIFSSPISSKFIELEGRRQEDKLSEIKGDLKFAKSLGFESDFIAMDATRADEDFLVELLREIAPYIDTFFVHDIGVAIPEIYKSKISKLVKNLPGRVKIGVNCYNYSGYANQNTIEGIKAGAEVFITTFGGIGSGTGRASTQEVLLELKKLGISSPRIDYEKLEQVDKKVYEFGKKKPAEPKTPEAHSYEAEEYVYWILKARDMGRPNPFLVELYEEKPEDLVFFGKYSGIPNFKFYFRDEYKDYEEMSEQVKDLSVALRKSFDVEELKNFIERGVIRHIGGNYLTNL